MDVKPGRAFRGVRRPFERDIAPLFLVSLAAFLVVSCREEPPALQVGDVSFSAAQVRGLPASQRDHLIAITAVGIATARGEIARLGEPIVAGWIDELRVQRLREETTLLRAGVDESALRAAYADDPEPVLTVRHLVVLSERFESAADRDQARARAAAALVRIQSGEDFGTVAGQVSEEPGAAQRGGLLDPGRQGTWVREFWDAARALEVGGVSDVVESPYGFHVIKLERRDPVPFEEARHRVVARLAAPLDDPSAWAAQVGDWIEGLPMDRMPRAEVPRAEVEAAAALDEARRRGIEPAPVEREELERRWEAAATGWGAALGFTPDMTAEAIAEQALLALGRTDQSARIARDEMARVRDALAAAHPVVVGEP